MRRFSEVWQELQRIFTSVLGEENRKRYDNELWRYYGHLKTEKGAQTRTRFLIDICRLARFDPGGTVILDAGCGFGALSILLMLLGAKRVCGVDVAEGRLTTFQKIIEDFQLIGQIEARLRGVEDTGYPDATFDMVLSNEAISHYPDVHAFLRETHRVLKPGGLLIIVDGNNGANLFYMRRLKEYWRRIEAGPVGETKIHPVKHTYLQMREEIIREAFAHVDESTVHELALRTSGMTQAPIVEAVNLFLQTGEKPSAFYQGGCPVNPRTGTYAEYAFDPRELVQLVNSHGFESRFYAYLGGAGGNPIVRALNNAVIAFSPITIKLTRAFRIVARRRH